LIKQYIIENYSKGVLTFYLVNIKQRHKIMTIIKQQSECAL